MNQEIKKRIDAIGNKDAVKLFFELINYLIRHLKLNANNEKLALNVRNDNRTRISVNVNGRLVLYIRSENIFGFMINTVDVPTISFVEKEEFKAKEPQASLISVEYTYLQENLDAIKSLWLQSCADYLPKQEKSQYRRYHIPELYNMATNPVLLNPYFDKITILVDDKNKANHNSLKKTPNTAITQQPLNQILFGPPGTGKTYNTINKALEIIGENIEGKTRKEIKTLFDAKMTEGQIVFTTFHQNMSYEDFIEGIKPETIDNSVIYNIKNGIFKEICSKANQKMSNFDTVIQDLKNEVNTNSGKTPVTIKAQYTTFNLSYFGGTVFYVTPHNSTKENPLYPVNIENIRKYYETGEAGTIYNITYVREIINFLKKKRTLSEPSDKQIEKPYVLIIDEINRGNVSQIFGELITLIEDDKRLGKSEALEVTLPYSKETFGVPSNLYIIGTMNTADRSVEALDAALRRRFSFEEMPPKYDLDGLKYEIAGINAADILRTINQRIEKLLDKDHAIGHAYFLQKENTPFPKESGSTTLKTLQNSFYKSIIPLLQEYFFGDYGKIGLVLGKGFIRRKKQSAFFADFDYESTNEFEDRAVFEIIDYRNPNNDLTFENALKLLMNQKIE